MGNIKLSSTIRAITSSLDYVTRLTLSNTQRCNFVHGRTARERRLATVLVLGRK